MNKVHNIVVVDDDYNILEMLRIMIEKAEGFKVHCTLDSEKAFDLIVQKDADAVILDIDMPKINGLALLKKLKDDNCTRHIPVIMLTGNDCENYLSSSMYWYADSFLTKPASKKMVMDAIAKALSVQKAEREKTPGSTLKSRIKRMFKSEGDVQHNTFASASIVTHGSRLQFGIAIALITVIPLLTLFYVFQMRSTGDNLSAAALWIVMALLLSTVCTGYAILAKYPITIIKLRSQMEMIARGEIPDSIELLDGESDIYAIQKYFNLIISGMKNRITTIKEQGELIVKAERQRVMTESLCTTCHCLGQPATSLGCYLDLMGNETLTENGAKYLVCCQTEAGRITEVLRELQAITDYVTEPYCEFGSEEKKKDMVNILQTKSTKREKRSKVVETLKLVLAPDGSSLPGSTMQEVTQWAAGHRLRA